MWAKQASSAAFPGKPRSSLDDSPVRFLRHEAPPEQGKIGHVATKLRSRCGTKPERHKRIVVRLIGLADTHERNARSAKPARFANERGFIGHAEHDSKRARTEIARRRLARGMDELRRNDTWWKVCPHNHVVRDGVRDLIDLPQWGDRPGVNASCAWF